MGPSCPWLLGSEEAARHKKTSGPVGSRFSWSFRKSDKGSPDQESQRQRVYAEKGQKVLGGPKQATALRRERPAKKATRDAESSPTPSISWCFLPLVQEGLNIKPTVFRSSVGAYAPANPNIAWKQGQPDRARPLGTRGSALL